MAFTAKFTVPRGKHAQKNVTITAGSAEAQTDTISLNIDATHMTKGDAIILLEDLVQKIHTNKWPPL
jgi:hypothetical protein